MKTSKATIQQIANNEIVLGKEATQVANIILKNGLYSAFNRYAFFYDGDSTNLLDVQDLLLDYKCFGAEIKMKVPACIHPSGTWQTFGMTPSASLERLMQEISNRPDEASEQLENSTFSIKGVKGKFSYISTYFHYCFGEGSITVDELLRMCQVA